MFKKILKLINPYLLVVIIVASVLRFANISKIPPSLNWDEVSHGYNAYSILTTGKDEWGVAFPTIFRAYGDYKLPVYIYTVALSEKFFGLNAFAVRLPSVLAGIGTVVFTYFLVLELFRNHDDLKRGLRFVAGLSALFVATEPWSLFLSRGAFEANLALFFVVSGIYFLLKTQRMRKTIIPGVVLLGLSVWTYNSARVFVPLVLAAFGLIYWKELLGKFKKYKKLFIFSTLLLLFFFVPMFVQLLRPVGQARYGKVSIIDQGAIAKIEQARNSSKLPPVLNRLKNNRYAYFSEQFVKNWASHYSASFLFLQGGKDYQFSVPGWGLLYWIDIIPVVVGLLWLVVKRSKTNALIIAWFFLGTVPSALTNEAPQVLRSIVVLPIPMIISAIGVFKIFEWLSKKLKLSQILLTCIYVAVLGLFLENYWMSYTTTYRNNYSWSWQYGYEQAVDYVKSHYNSYDKIMVTKKYGEPHEFFLFFWPWNPSTFLSETKDTVTQPIIRFYQSGWYWTDEINNIYFINDWNIADAKSVEGFIDEFQLEYKEQGSHVVTDCGYVIDIPKSSQGIREGGNCLLITSPGNVPSNKWEKLETINFLDGNPAFEIYKIKPVTYQQYVKFTQ